MSEGFTIQGLLRANARAQCRISYSINHKQPVLCTLLHNNPYFFDVDPTALVEEAAAVYASEDKPYDMPEILRAARATSDGFVTLIAGEDQLMTDDAAMLCQNALNGPCVTDFDSVLETLRLSTTARHMLDAHNVTLSTSAAQEGVIASAVDAQNNVTITINPFLPNAQAALLIVRALRMAQLDSVKPQLRNIDRAILLHRSIMAELNGVMIQVAWEANLAGHSDLWMMISRSAMADQAYAFGGRVTSDFRALRDGRAAIAAFDQWFYSGRTRKTDRALIQSLLAHNADDLAEGASLSDTMDALRAIGDRGIGKNYLIDHLQALLSDGFYGEVRDRSNANFMWFVKFERSYRAIEDVMNEETAPMPTTVPPSQSMATVLRFPRAHKKHAKLRKPRKESSVVTLEARKI